MSHHPGHDEVEDDEVGSELSVARLDLSRVTGSHHPTVSFFSKEPFEEMHNHRVVIDQKDLSSFGPGLGRK